MRQPCLDCGRTGGSRGTLRFFPMRLRDDGWRFLMRDCEFCGVTTGQGSNEFGEFTCPSCLDEMAAMQPLAAYAP